MFSRNSFKILNGLLLTVVLLYPEYDIITAYCVGTIVKFNLLVGPKLIFVHIILSQTG